MADVQVTITNLAEIKAAFNKAPKLMAKELDDAIQKSMFVIQAETIKNVHPNRGINVITGGLLSATERPPVFMPLKAVYDIDIKYGIFVHEGTRFMRGRPFLADAVGSMNETIQKFFTKAVDNVLSTIGKSV